MKHFFFHAGFRTYASQLGAENLFVLDHGSSDLSTQGLGRTNIIRVPRSAYDEVRRVDFATHIHSALLAYYDAGFFVDADEFLVTEPTKYKNLAEFAANGPADAPACVGLELFHIRHLEPAFRSTIPILSQRKYVRFDSWMCKRSFARKQIRFGGGFHTSDQPVVFDENLFLFHMKNFDYDHRVLRQTMTAVWDYAGDFGVHARKSADTVESVFQDVERIAIEGNIAYDLNFKEEIARCEQRAVINPSGEYDFNLHGGFFSEKLHVVPENFRALF